MRKFKLFKSYNYHKIDSDMVLIKADNEILLYKAVIIFLAVMQFVNIFNTVETKTVLRYVKQLHTDTLEKVVLVRSSNLTKIEFPRSQNIPTALNNPGCIRPGNKEIDKYAIGIVDTKSGPFLAFMNPKQGFKALKVLLKRYSNFTVRDMIKRYAPSFENDTKGYIRNLCKNLKCKQTTLVKDVNQDDLAIAISKIEGFKN